MKVKLHLAAAAVSGLLGPASWAQSFEGAQGFDVERFRMTLDPGGILSVESAFVPRHLSWNVGMWLGAADDPLVLNRLEADGSDTRVGDLVSTRLGGSLIASVGLFEWVQLGIEAPVVVFQSRASDVPGVAEPLQPLQSFGFGGPRVAAKLRILREDEAGVALAVVPAVVLPALSGGDGYLGDRSVGLAPDVVLSKRFGVLRAAGNLGYRSRPDDALLNLTIKDELTARVGVGVSLQDLGLPPFGVDVALSTATAVDAIFEHEVQDHVELLAGGRYAFDGPLLAFVGSGVGLARGHGTPDWRVFAGLRFSSDVGTDAMVPGILPDGRDRFPEEVKPPAAVEAQEAAVEPAAAERELPEDVAQAEEQPEPAAEESGPTEAVAQMEHAAVEPPAALPRVDTIVLFATESATVRSKYLRPLRGVASRLDTDRLELIIVITGHTDSRGSDAYNDKLAVRRALAVQRVLIEAGVPKAATEVRGRGRHEPRASNATRKGRALNRRVELEVQPQAP